MKKFLLIGCWLIVGCYYHKEDEACSTANVTYSNTVAAIVSSHGCFGCHAGTSPEGGFTLTDYDRVKAKATQTRNGTSLLYGALAHQAGFSAMPKGMPALSDCELAKIKAWIDAGTPQ